MSTLVGSKIRSPGDTCQIEGTASAVSLTPFGRAACATTADGTQTTRHAEIPSDRPNLPIRSSLAVKKAGSRGYESCAGLKR
jgi:hypothetical protein